MSNVISQIDFQTKEENNKESGVEEQAIIDQNYKYYIEFQKLNEANAVLANQLQELTKERNILKQRLNKLEIKKKNFVQSKVIDDTYNIRRVRNKNWIIKIKFSKNNLFKINELGWG
jgi:hypothetical protein